MSAFFSDNPLIVLFLVLAAGYALGRIRFLDMSLGTAGILIAALFFGHFGLEVPSVIQNIGLVCFVTSVGFIAGPEFFGHFSGGARAYVTIGVVIIISGILTCLAVMKFGGISKDLALGLMAGALTTTPGLAAGIEATGSEMVSVGYGIAYPFGVLSVVLFVQALPKLMKTDFSAERSRESMDDNAGKKVSGKLITMDPLGFFPFSVAIVAGILIGLVNIPIPGGGFSLGTSGGPLFAGILIGHFGRAGRVDLRVKKEVLNVMREFGLALFLAGAGTHAGTGFVEILAERGAVLFVYGALISVVPLAAGYLTAHFLFRLNMTDALGSVCGGMTSTPALGALMNQTGTTDATFSYAATYPVALALIVLLTGWIGRI